MHSVMATTKFPGWAEGKRVADVGGGVIGAVSGARNGTADGGSDPGMRTNS